MASSRRYNLMLRRRREGKTDYPQRLKLLRSRKARLVVRKTNRNTIVQFVAYEPDGDVVQAQASTDQLEKLGWKHATGNLPAAYLAGYLAGVRAKKAGVTEAVADIGMQIPKAGGRLFAAVLGARDAGIDIPVSDDVIPAEDRVSGAHIDEKLASAVEQVKKKAGEQ